MTYEKRNSRSHAKKHKANCAPTSTQKTLERRMEETVPAYRCSETINKLFLTWNSSIWTWPSALPSLQRSSGTESHEHRESRRSLMIMIKPLPDKACQKPSHRVMRKTQSPNANTNCKGKRQANIRTCTPAKQQRQ
jgi:hypothetical protein